MEAQAYPKAKRFSELSFEPRVTITVGDSDSQGLNVDHIKTLLLGLDRQFPWYAPNERTRHIPDFIEISETSAPSWVHISFRHDRSVLRGNQVDAYLRYLEKLYIELSACLEGRYDVDVQLDLCSLVMSLKGGG